MRNIKLTVAYDGTDFAGWQVQPGQPTIQGTLCEVLERITRQETTVQGAGRTDAGVHALAQVAHFHTDADLTTEDFQRACNALLPPTIRVFAAEEVDPDFHARWNSVGKTYRYRIYRGRVVAPFLWRYVHHDASALDFDAMSEAAAKFEGEHDFTTFAASTGSEEEDRERLTTRTIYNSKMLRVRDENDPGGAEDWIYEVRGKSFLRYMVRKIMGGLVEVGRGKLRPEDIPPLIELRDRSRSGPTMPPQGLCLVKVEYPAKAAAKET